MKKRLYGKSREIDIFENQTELLGWLKRGNFRQKVLSEMEGEMMPSEIVGKVSKDRSRKTASHYAMVSRTMAEFEMQGLVQCLNPKEKKGRLYTLTSKGKKIQKRL